jgi:hypothetical protein
MLWGEIEHQLNLHASKGGKASRKRQCDRVRSFMAFCKGKGVRGPDQIGKRHVYEWYEDGGFAESTLRDRFYAVSLLWSIIGRGSPPNYK